MGAAIPERHPSGDDIVLQSIADSAARDERSAAQEEQCANETDRSAADLGTGIAPRCEGNEQRNSRHRRPWPNF